MSISRAINGRKPKILGRQVDLLIISEKEQLPIPLGSIDEFSATSTTEYIKTRPVGYIIEHSTLRYGGYELSLKLSKRDSMLERWFFLTEVGLIKKTQPPRFKIIETLRHIDGLYESWVYHDVTLFGVDVNFSGEGEYEQSVKGFANRKERGPLDMLPANILQMDFKQAGVTTLKAGLIDWIHSSRNSVDDALYQQLLKQINDTLGSDNPIITERVPPPGLSNGIFD
jgi:hypothetical protein